MIELIPAPRLAPTLTFRGGSVIARLLPSDAREVGAFLGTHPAANAYLLGHLARGALDSEAAGTLLGWWEDGRLAGVACIGANLVLSHGAPTRALEAFADFTHSAPGEVRVIVGADEMVARFMVALGLPDDAYALERPGQVLMQVDNKTLHRDARSVELRPAQPNELDLMMAADLEMVREELGFDPFSSDLSGFRRGWQRRIQEWRAWVAGPLGGPIHCKVDQAAVSDEVVQLAGVYTAPAYRRLGLARRAVGEMCHLLLREVARVTLYVNPDNAPALRLYRSLGFYEVGRVRSVWLRPA